MDKKYSKDLTIILPSMNEGESVSKLLDELLFELKQLNLDYEILCIDTPSKHPSFETFKNYAEKYPEITAIELADIRKSGSDKAVKYMVGFEMAKGKYIITMDSDGQDNPVDLPKFIEKLQEGVGLVVGHKQNRKDGQFYMFTSSISNFLNRKFFGLEINDMNCGFKGYQWYVAKGLNIRGRWYRFIPALVEMKGHSIVEVPIDNRKREFGKTNFDFVNRLNAGLFDFLSIIAIRLMGDNQNYFYSWFALLMILSGVLNLFTSLILYLIGSRDYFSLMFGIFGTSSFVVAFVAFMISFALDFYKANEYIDLEKYNIKRIYKQD